MDILFSSKSSNQFSNHINVANGLNVDCYCKHKTQMTDNYTNLCIITLKIIDIILQRIEFSFHLDICIPAFPMSFYRAGKLAEHIKLFLTNSRIRYRKPQPGVSLGWK